MDGGIAVELPTVAALYVERGGSYYGLPGVDPWDEQRDARLYAGPWPVVAHPPCARWCRMAAHAHSRGAPPPGEDGGCFRAALASVRQWGGVLEHPAYSAAWKAHGLLAPPKSGGWVPAGDGLGSTCYVEQGHYEHPALKGTWLYATRVELPALAWGPSPDAPFVGGSKHPHLAYARRKPVEVMSKAERIVTPPPFRDVLLAMARSVGAASAQAASSPRRPTQLSLFDVGGAP